MEGEPLSLSLRRAWNFCLVALLPLAACRPARPTIRALEQEVGSLEETLDGRRKDLAIATLSAQRKQRAEGHGMCGLLSWCRQAQVLSAAVPKSEVVVLTDAERLDDCPHARIVPFDEHLQRRLRAYVDAHKSLPDGGEFGATTLQKLQLLRQTDYRAIFFTDWDVDLVPARLSDASGGLLPAAKTAFGTQLEKFLVSSAELLSTPDHSAPVNAGVWLAKPAASAFDAVSAWLRDGTAAVWTDRAGFDGVGAPQSLEGAAHFPKTQMWRDNTWRFVGGGGDQGLLFYLFCVQRKACAQATQRTYQVDHWWGGGKPWTVSEADPRALYAQRRYYEALRPLEGADTPCARTLRARKEAIDAYKHTRAQPELAEGREPPQHHPHLQMVFERTQRGREDREPGDGDGELHRRRMAVF